MSALPEPMPGESQLDTNQIEMLRTLRQGALLPQLLRTWREQAPKQLRELHDAIQRRDAVAVGTLAHGFKSASYSIGAKFVGEACTELETAARNGDLSNALQLFSHLQQCFISVQPELDRYL